MNHWFFYHKIIIVKNFGSVSRKLFFLFLLFYYTFYNDLPFFYDNTRKVKESFVPWAEGSAVSARLSRGLAVFSTAKSKSPTSRSPKKTSREYVNHGKVLVVADWNLWTCKSDLSLLSLIIIFLRIVNILVYKCIIIRINIIGLTKSYRVTRAEYLLP